MRTKFVCGNWKMNSTPSESRHLLFQLVELWPKQCEGILVAVCPPFTSLSIAAEILKGSTIAFGAQNCYYQDSGAVTGEISPVMLRELGCTYVILGHSERRTLFAESDGVINKKLQAALRAGLKPIVCIGETESQRETDQTETVLDRQLSGSLAGLSSNDMCSVTIAYEPVWAIGTGKTATAAQAQAAHAFIRSKLRQTFGDVAENVIIQYGGSVKPDNAFELFSQQDIDGGLIGGASLSAESFIAIAQAARQAQSLRVTDAR